VYYFDGSDFALIPEDDLPGNSEGFSASPVDLSLLPAGSYEELQVGVFFTSTDVSVTPALLSWEVSYIAGPTPLPGVDFSLRGTKTIGATGEGSPIYKLDEVYATNQYGEWGLDPLDPDLYSVTVLEPSYNLYEQCPFTLSVLPGSSATLSMTLIPETDNSLLVNIEGNDAPVSGAQILLSGPEDRDGITSLCGQSFFADLTPGAYTISISAPGFQPHTEAVPVSDESVFSVTLSP
jgi:hypothetical protein